MTKITAPWISRASSRAVVTAIEAGGFQALFVGGCVRNALIGAPVADIDIATDAPPHQVIRLAEAAGLKAIATGIEHGTVTLVSDGIPFEVTTFRRDVETDGRRAVVAFSTDITQDARRRDFTMNALYAQSDGAVIDPLGKGLSDLSARKVRFIDDAEARIHEDYLRILRFFRFHAWYGKPEIGPDPEALAAISSSLGGLAGLSAERIGAEMTKLTAAPDPAPAFATMEQVGVLTHVLPGADAKAIPLLIDLETRLSVEPDAMRRLAVIGGEDVGNRLRLSRKDARRLEIIGLAARNMMGPEELGYRLGAQTAWDALLVRSALSGSDLSAVAYETVKRGAAAQFPISAHDLQDRLAGPELGAELKRLENRWIASGFAIDRASLLAHGD